MGEGKKEILPLKVADLDHSSIGKIGSIMDSLGIEGEIHPDASLHTVFEMLSGRFAKNTSKQNKIMGEIAHVFLAAQALGMKGGKTAPPAKKEEFTEFPIMKESQAMQAEVKEVRTFQANMGTYHLSDDGELSLELKTPVSAKKVLDSSLLKKIELLIKNPEKYENEQGFHAIPIDKNSSICVQESSEGEYVCFFVPIGVGLDKQVPGFSFSYNSNDKSMHFFSDINSGSRWKVMRDRGDATNPEHLFLFELKKFGRKIFRPGGLRALGAANSQEKEAGKEVAESGKDIKFFLNTKPDLNKFAPASDYEVSRSPVSVSCASFITPSAKTECLYTFGMQQCTGIIAVAKDKAGKVLVSALAHLSPPSQYHVRDIVEHIKEKFPDAKLEFYISTLSHENSPDMVGYLRKNGAIKALLRRDASSGQYLSGKEGAYNFSTEFTVTRDGVPMLGVPKGSDTSHGTLYAKTGFAENYAPGKRRIYLEDVK
ncbi:hypothetical protein COU37_05325 [Candidatus Micrarchaeota archaeon CG10_big_fil_rev_8_21_14_0_10_45_29]|nr:MAG: hypothetical protein COU37_05325 [Candidatus Micrarchaeota archaeon CG10_big_fil_rev_8_21_14_0_10_45_29]